MHSDGSSKCDPMQRLSFDVATLVFSRLDQKSCLRAMAVCKSWRDHIPMLCTDAWKHVILDGSVQKDGSCPILLHRSLHQCLGPHVKQVSLRRFRIQEHVYKMMDILSCCNQIRALCFEHCCIIDQARFIKHLQPLSTHLTKLVFLDHEHNLAFIPILTCCSNLIHFTLKTKPLDEPQGMFDMEPDIPTLDKPFLNLSYLCLGAKLHKHQRVLPILRKCPNLRCLRIGAFKQAYDPVSANTTFISDLRDRCHEEALRTRDTIAEDLGTVRALCPHLQYLGLNCYRDNAHNWIEYEHQHRNGLVFLDVTKLSEDSSDVIPLIAQAQDSLEHLGIHFHTSGPQRQGSWANLATMQLRNLRSLSCRFLIYLDDDHLAALIRRCDLLEDVELIGTQGNIQPVVIHALRGLSGLRRLTLYYDQDDMVPTYSNGAIYDLLQHHARLGDSLKQIRMNAANDRIIELLGQIESLESIQLLTMDENVKEKTMMDFAQCLLEHDRVHTLEFNYFQLSDGVLRLLGQLSHLKAIDFYCSHVSPKGLDAFLDSAIQLQILRLTKAKKGGPPVEFDMRKASDKTRQRIHQTRSRKYRSFLYDYH
ncbi:hypothetical protein BJV82DRAFT_599030 [Fennellomyces sp. T-0311]|nr:hypothetical protein BJV82DRAFT_599030 [Fennellomyces sp. T-0311]